METATKTIIQINQKRLLAAQQLDAWRRRNAHKLKGWDPVAVLRQWREKRWSSSTPQ